MWGPYGRTPYARSYTSAEIYSQTLTATWIAAANLGTLRVLLLTLAATYTYQGRRLIRRAGKLLQATTEWTGQIKRQMQLTIRGTFIAAGAAALKKNLYRTLSATYVMDGKVYKKMFQTLAATTVWIATRLTIEEVLGWEYTGDLAPGDRLKIDRDLLTATLNGSNVLHLVEGEFPFFTPGENSLTYQDGTTGKEITLRITWRGKWL